MKKTEKTQRAAAGICAGIFGLLWMCFLGGCAKEEYRFSNGTSTGGEQIADARQTESVGQEENGMEKTAPEDDISQKDVSGDTGDCGNRGVCYVHICGAVKQPGVYRVDAGSRLYEVILLAGGLTGDAAGQAVNQAQELVDGMQIYIPTNEEVQNGMYSGPDYRNGQGASQDTRVNLNTADADLLCTLPGIGAVRAKAIIAYREEHGAFQSVEELMNVAGIKVGVYEKIKELIKV